MRKKEKKNTHSMEKGTEKEQNKKGSGEHDTEKDSVSERNMQRIRDLILGDDKEELAVSANKKLMSRIKSLENAFEKKTASEKKHFNTELKRIEEKVESTRKDIEKDYDEKLTKIDKKYADEINELKGQVSQQIDDAKHSVDAVDDKLTSFKNELNEYLENNGKLENKRNESILSTLEGLEEEIEEMKKVIDQIPVRFRKSPRT